MKINLKLWCWCLLGAFALSFLTGCIVDDRDHRGAGPGYYGHGGGEYHDWDHDHWDHR